MVNACIPAVTIHLDEIDAARIGEQFLKEQARIHTEKRLRRVPQPDDATQALPFKAVAMIDSDDHLLACYILNRTLLNRTQLTMVAGPGQRQS